MSATKQSKSLWTRSIEAISDWWTGAGIARSLTEEGSPPAPVAPPAPRAPPVQALPDRRAPRISKPVVAEVAPVPLIKADEVPLANGPRTPLIVSLPSDSVSRLLVPDPDSKIATVRLIRTSSSSHGTFGTIMYGKWNAHSLELPWHNNQQTVSCIPKGVYDVEWSYSPRFQRRMYCLVNVPNRAGIRIHSANIAGDVLLGLKTHLNGCITMGERIGILSNQKAVLNSATMIVQFEQLLLQKPFRIIIDGVVG